MELRMDIGEIFLIRLIPQPAVGHSNSPLDGYIIWRENYLLIEIRGWEYFVKTIARDQATTKPSTTLILFSDGLMKDTKDFS